MERFGGLHRDAAAVVRVVRVQVTEGSENRPPSGLQRYFHSRHALDPHGCGCRTPQTPSTPSISFPMEVSLIGSVADRSEIPRAYRCARSAKWLYLSRANLVRLKTTTNWTAPLVLRQNCSSFWRSVRSAVLALSPCSRHRASTWKAWRSQSRRPSAALAD